MAAALARLHDAYYIQHGRTAHLGEMHMPGSPADLECAQEPYADVWGPTPTRDATIDVLLPVMAALDHLKAMETLLASPGSVYAPLTLARSVMEISAQVWYLVEPEIGPEERAIRHVNRRLQSLWEQMQIPGKATDEAAEKMRRQARARMDDIVQAARACGIQARGRGDERRPPAVGTPLKSTTTLVEECVSAASPRLGPLFWRFYSAVTHGQSHGLLASFTAVGPDSGAPDVTGVSFGQIQLAPTDAAIQTAGAPLAAISMLERLFTLLGWDDSELKAAKFSVLTTWGRVGRIALYPSS